jgi:hypothetical protein
VSTPSKYIESITHIKSEIQGTISYCALFAAKPVVPWELDSDCRNHFHSHSWTRYKSSAQTFHLKQVQLPFQFWNNGGSYDYNFDLFITMKVPLFQNNLNRNKFSIEFQPKSNLFKGWKADTLLKIKRWI